MPCEFQQGIQAKDSCSWGADSPTVHPSGQGLCFDRHQFSPPRSHSGIVPTSTSAICDICMRKGQDQLPPARCVHCFPQLWQCSFDRCSPATGISHWSRLQIDSRAIKSRKAEVALSQRNCKLLDANSQVPDATKDPPQHHLGASGKLSSQLWDLDRWESQSIYAWVSISSS